MTAEQFWPSVTLRRVDDFDRVWEYPEKFGVLNASVTHVTSVIPRTRLAGTDASDPSSGARHRVSGTTSAPYGAFARERRSRRSGTGGRARPEAVSMFNRPLGGTAFLHHRLAVLSERGQ
jgi:hypothetical protein